MIVYNRLWETMQKKGITQYALIKKHNVSPAQINVLFIPLPLLMQR